MREDKLVPPAGDLFRLAVELSPAGILATNASGTILLVSREVERLFGYGREELIGAPADVLLPRRLRGPASPFRPGDLAVPGSQPGGSDAVGLRKDGVEVPVRIGINQVRTEDALVVLASIVDISARRRAEQRFQAAVESSPSGMLMTDRSGTILLVNREVERLFGYDREELIGKPVEMLIPERFRQEHPRARAEFRADPRKRPMGAGRDLFGLRRDGTEVPIEIGLNPITTDEGLHILASIVDITARRAAEDQLRQSQKMEAIGTLAGGIAHDFNNLLLAIMGHAELAAGTAGDNPALKADLAQVLKAAERGRQLVKRILSASRRRGITRTRVHLEQPVREALQLLRASLPTTIEIREHLDPQTPEVLSDDTLVHQVLMNLATNAAHAMPAGGLLHVWVGPFEVSAVPAAAATPPGLEPGCYARISVADTGHGMPPEVLRRAFEPFFTTKPAGAGSGLGLSIVHGIVHSHGGAIQITSEPGKGTRVDVYVPAIEAAAELEVPAARSASAAASPHILLVEDEVLLAEMMRRQIMGLGYRVTVHTSSLDALEDLRSRPTAFNALVTDNTMPRMTGLALTREILRLRPDLPVLLISGLVETADPETLHAEGIRRLLPKPHTRAELEEALRAMLE